jgi:hypothetical protein
MNRKLSFFGALHPFFFMAMIYVISVVMAFFVCSTIYNSLHQTPDVAGNEEVKMESLAALK